MTLPVLWHFRFSHFNEKARWALDWKGIPHVRRAVVPGLHVPRMLWMTGQKQVPVLMVDGKPIVDSTRIIARLEQGWPEPALYPADPAGRRRALDLEEHFDTELGPHIRRAIFHDLLPASDAATSLLTTGCGAGMRQVYRPLFPAIRAVMRMDLRIDDAGAQLGREKTVAAIALIERELRPSGYLAGDAFSVADLTAAALLSPILLPPEFPYAFDLEIPAPIASFRASVADRPGFRWALDMYRRHRGTSAEATIGDPATSAM